MMAIDFKKARDFVYNNGVVWERRLFGYLFEGGDLNGLHAALRAYRNADGGYGHALEHDIRAPQSHPLALEYLLGALVENRTPPGDLLDGAAAWVEANQNDDGSLRNPTEVVEYPHAPWWDGGGQSIPASLTGNLIRFGKATDAIRAKTLRWAAEHLTPEKIRATDWLFMAYHAYDYTFNEDRLPDADAHRDATIETIVRLASAAPDKQAYTVFRFAPTPDSPVAKALPPAVLSRHLDLLMNGQQDDGGWNDEHGLAHWRPIVTISNLLALRTYGCDIGV